MDDPEAGADELVAKADPLLRAKRAALLACRSGSLHSASNTKGSTACPLFIRSGTSAIKAATRRQSHPRGDEVSTPLNASILSGSIASDCSNTTTASSTG